MGRFVATLLKPRSLSHCIASGAMDVLTTGTLMHLCVLLPDGPTEEFIQTLAQSRNQFDNHDMPTSLRMAMVRAFSMARHRNIMLAEWGALDGQQLAPVATPTPPPPPPSALFRPCHEPIGTVFAWNGGQYCSQQCRHDAGDRSAC